MDGHRHGRSRHPKPSVPSCCRREWNAHTAQLLGSPGLSKTRSHTHRWHGPAWHRHRHRCHWSLLIHGGGDLRVPCSCSCPLSLPLPPAWHLAGPETGGHCDTAATHSLWRTGRLGGRATSQPAGRTKIPSLQLALPSISGHSFLIPLDLSPIARTGALGQPPLLPQYHSTGTLIQGLWWAGMGLGQAQSCWFAVDVRTRVCLFARRRQATPQHEPRFGVRSTECVEPWHASVKPLSSIVASESLAPDPESRLDRSWSMLRVVDVRVVDVRNRGPDAATLPPVSLSFPPKKTHSGSRCVSLTHHSRRKQASPVKEALTLPALWSPTLHALHKAHDDHLNPSRPTDPSRWGQRHNRRPDFFSQIFLALGQGPLQRYPGSIQGGLSLLNDHIPSLTHTLSPYPSVWLEKALLLSRSSSAAVQGLWSKLLATMRRAGVEKSSFSRQRRKAKSLGAELALLPLRLISQVPLATSGHNRAFSQQYYVMKTQPGPPQ